MMARHQLAASVLMVLAISCGGDTAGSEEFCSAARDLAGVTPGDLDRTLDNMERLRAAAPDEIKDSINTLADATKEVADSGDPTILERQEVLDASADLDDYLEENCEAPE